MLAIVGAVVMLIVGSSLARAFGIVGVASLIRYRAKIDDPKDAVVMLASLTLGLACGVELYGLAVFATAVHPRRALDRRIARARAAKDFELKVTAPDPAILRGRRIDPAGVPASSSSCAVPAPKSWSTRPRCRWTSAPIASPNAILLLKPGGETEVRGKRRRSSGGGASWPAPCSSKGQDDGTGHR